MNALRPTIASVRLTLALSLLLTACGGDLKPSSDDTGGEGAGGGNGGTQVDADADGYPAEFDCDDDNSAIFPGAVELCNDIDDNCDGSVDEGLPDVDGDGTPDCSDVEECDGVDNDGDGLIDEDQPDADGDGTPDCQDLEICDGIDNDGNGLVDDGFDADGDGYSPCSDELGAWDCDDSDPALNPGAREVAGDDIDNNCDGLIDPARWGDGTVVITEVLANPGYVRDSLGEWIELYNPGAEALYLNGIELRSGDESHVIIQATPLVIEAGGYAVIGASTDMRENGSVEVNYGWSDILLDNEGDNIELWRDGALLDAVAWDPTTGWPALDGASLSLDPLQIDAALNDALESWCPGSATLGRSLDLASPGEANPACPAVDRDGDGFLNDVDCNDADAAVSPGAGEIVYDGVDNDCNPGTPDDDLDGDGYAMAADCDDGDAAISPDAVEAPYDGVDNDCNPGTPDDDLDGDGSLFADDCDDADAARAPTIAEACDGIDNDCDLLVDNDDPDTAGTCP